MSTNGGADPAVAARLADEMRSLAFLVETSDVATFVNDDNVFTEAQRLLQALEGATGAAQAERHLAGPD